MKKKKKTVLHIKMTVCRSYEMDIFVVRFIFTQWIRVIHWPNFLFSMELKASLSIVNYKQLCNNCNAITNIALSQTITVVHIIRFTSCHFMHAHCTVILPRCLQSCIHTVCCFILFFGFFFLFFFLFWLHSICLCCM